MDFRCAIRSTGGAVDAASVVVVANTSEDLGYSSVWVSDHFVMPSTILPPPEPLLPAQQVANGNRQ
jgi:alkanesulfonate monooxygenase SsuD/methylene tetrahydromethanopterin reductase-like flavin-dependent oxidoreductase (luciferase family)